MAKALRHSEVRGHREAHKPVEWTKRMSDHIAAALLIYTALHIIVTMQAIKGEGGSILPYFGLVLLVGAIIPGCVVRARPIGVLNLEDEHGGDEKLICVPIDTTFPYYSDVAERQDLPSIIFQQIEHFFTHYKDLEADKWVRVGKWGDAAEARQIVIEAIERAK